MYVHIMVSCQACQKPLSDDLSVESFENRIAMIAGSICIVFVYIK